MEINKLHNIDCFEGHKQIEDSSIDLIYTDLPYSQTKNYWDTPIDLVQLWIDYKRILKPNGIIVLHAQGMFSAKLMYQMKNGGSITLYGKRLKELPDF